MQAKTFDARNKMLNDKIEYDQRFFCSSYSGMQNLISDIRDAIKVNNELLQLKKKAKSICNEINN